MKAINLALFQNPLPLKLAPEVAVGFVVEHLISRSKNADTFPRDKIQLKTILTVTKLSVTVTITKHVYLSFLSKCVQIMH